MNAIILAAVISALSPQQVVESNTPDTNLASEFAVQAAIIAGGARNCQFDKDQIDEYISLAQVRIKTLSKDKEENVLAKLDFSNSLLVAAIKPPEGGCKDFNITFRSALHDLN